MGDLRALCSKFDVDDTGFLTSSQWKRCVENGKMLEYLDRLGFPPYHLDKFYHMLTTDHRTEGEVVIIEDFVRGCMRMRGTASCFDMNTVKFEVSAMKELLVEEVRNIHALVGKKVRRMLAVVCLRGRI